MPLQAWLDESGVNAQSRAFVFAGWIGEAERWAAFSDDWQALLESDRPIRHFSMREAALKRGEFSRFSADERDLKVRALARLIGDHGFRMFWCVTDVPAFQRTFARAYRRHMRDLYFWPFQMTMLGLGLDMHHERPGERGEIIFDEQWIFASRVKEIYPKVKQAIKDDAIRSVLPPEPRFLDDKKFPPLQAADLLAWNLHRNLSKVEPNRFAELLIEEFGHVEESMFSQVLDEERMLAILNRSVGSLGGP